MKDSLDPALGNIVATLALTLTDRMTEATEQAAGRGGQAPAALVALEEFLGGGTIEQLRQTLGISHSAAVRLVDRLADDGFVLRGERLTDGRSVALELTRTGRSVARRVLAARRLAVEESLASLDECERRNLHASVRTILAAVTRSRLAARATGQPPQTGWMCRLCDFQACGRPVGRCPTAIAAAGPPSQPDLD